MKKILLFLFVLFLLPNNVFANDYMNFCSADVPKKTISGNFLSISGINTLTRNIVEYEIKRILKKETNSNFNIKMNNFYGTNVLNGEFKSLVAKAKKFEYENIFVSDLYVETLCPYNHISYENDELKFKTNVVIKYSAKITQDDLDKIYNANVNEKIIDKMNKNKILSSSIKIKTGNVEINGDKLTFRYEIVPILQYNIKSFLPISIKPIKISFSTGLAVENNKLKLNNYSLKRNYLNFSSIVSLLDPLLYSSFDIDKNKKGENRIENVKISNSIIYIDGIILIKQDKK